MKPYNQRLRASFFIYVLHSIESERTHWVRFFLDLGFQCEGFEDIEQLLDGIKESPPHMIFFGAFDPLIPREFLIRAVKQISDEIHIFGAATPEQMHQERPLPFQKSCKWIFYWKGLLEPFGLAADEAMERDYLLYLNEHLHKERAQETDPEKNLDRTQIMTVAPEMRSENTLSDFLPKIYRVQSEKEAIRLFLETSVAHLKTTVLYLKYLPQFSSLIAADVESLHASGFTEDRASMKGQGVKLKENGQDWETSLLSDAADHPLLLGFVKESLGWNAYTAIPLDLEGELKGLFLIEASETSEFTLGHSHLNSWSLMVEALVQVLQKLQFEKRFHLFCEKDIVTKVFHRLAFTERVQQEVQRARRLQMPVSLMLLQVDQLQDSESTIGQGKGNAKNNAKRDHSLRAVEQRLILKMIVSILQKSSRPTDVIGRLGAYDFAVLLPHTPVDGACIKAERFRRVIEAAQFNRLSNGLSKVTVSIGLSEYPSHCLDAEELFFNADQALSHIFASGQSVDGNQVCVYTPAPNFEPDFKVGPTL